MTENPHDLTIGLLASVPNWTVAMLAFVMQQDLPLWLYVLIAIGLPVFLVVLAKSIEIGYAEFKAKRGR